jgi:hypothetical protein
MKEMIITISTYTEFQAPVGSFDSHAPLCAAADACSSWPHAFFQLLNILQVSSSSSSSSRAAAKAAATASSFHDELACTWHRHFEAQQQQQQQQQTLHILARTLHRQCEAQQRRCPTAVARALPSPYRHNILAI